jgi:hypothetical protein
MFTTANVWLNAERFSLSHSSSNCFNAASSRKCAWGGDSDSTDAASPAPGETLRANTAESCGRNAALTKTFAVQGAMATGPAPRSSVPAVIGMPTA